MTSNRRFSGFSRPPFDPYGEPTWAVEALLDVESFSGPILDPACGSGTIPLVFRQHGIPASGSDIVDSGFGDVGDFFDRREPAANIVSNPPPEIALPFIEHAFTVTSGKVAILTHLAFVESILALELKRHRKLKRRRKVIDRTQTMRTWVFGPPVSLPPENGKNSATGRLVAYAWFVWQQAGAGGSLFDALDEGRVFLTTSEV